MRNSSCQRAGPSFLILQVVASEAGLAGTDTQPPSARASLNGHLCEPSMTVNPSLQGSTQAPRVQGLWDSKARCCTGKETVRSPRVIP